MERIRTLVYYKKFLFRRELVLVYQLFVAVQSPEAPRFYEMMNEANMNEVEKILAHHIFTNELGIPTCTIEKEYALGAVGQLRTRFQAFIESLEIKQIQGGK